MGVLKNRMDDAERFARFLRREAAGYHAPPDAPADAMWTEIEIRLAGDVPQVGGTASRADDSAEEPFEALGYHEPPPAPREAMWARIESAWVARRPVEVEKEAREVSPGVVRLAAHRGLGRRPRRTAVWLTGAAAASVALAFALGRGSRLPVTAEPEMVAAAAPESVATTDSGPIASSAAGETLVPSLVEEPMETSRQFAAATPPAAADPAPPVRAAVTSPPQRPVDPSPSRAQADEYDTSRHFDRATTLLVAFRTDIGSDESERDLARWARQLLVETRSHLDRSGPGHQARSLLQDLELVLVQIARLGPDAPDFERDLARENMEQQRTLMRLRSAGGT